LLLSAFNLFLNLCTVWHYAKRTFSLFSCKILTYAAEIHISKQIFSKTPSSNTQTQILIQTMAKMPHL